MKFVFDHYALQYMLEQFPRNIATELWELFITSCNDETIVSHREAQKLLEQEVVEQDSLDWIKNNSAIFKTTTTVESELLGTMMDKGVFEFLSTPQLIQRRMPEAIPFILCMAKKQNRCFVYRKNTNIDFIAKAKKVCGTFGIQHMEIEECLMTLKAERM